MDKKKKVFVVGLDEFNLSLIEQLPECEDCEIIPAVKFSEMRGVEDFSIPDLLKKTEERVEKKGGIDAVVSYFDFPGSIMVPIIAQKYDLIGPDLESVMKCEHKYWSRLEQYKAIPGNIPEFKAFDPFDEQAYDKIDFKTPFWIKPIKSYHSFLAYKVKDKKHFYECMKGYVKILIISLSRLTIFYLNMGCPNKYPNQKNKCLPKLLFPANNALQKDMLLTVRWLFMV